MDWSGILLGTFAFLLGGVLKGATGVGAPILAIPLLTWLYGVPVAVTLFSLPNFVSNVLQAWQFRRHRGPGWLTWPFAVAGILGAGAGTLILVRLPADYLLLAMAAVVFLYVGFRLLRPGWRLPDSTARRIAAPVGFSGGLMFGAVGISSPIAVTFLSALHLDRAVFIFTASVFFVASGVLQVPILVGAGVMTRELAIGSLLAVLPIWAGMPLGALAARHVSPATFDRLIQALLCVIALRLVARVFL